MKYINGENIIKTLTPEDVISSVGKEITFPAYIYQIRKGTGFSFVFLRCGRFIFQTVYAPQLCKTPINLLCEGAYIKATGNVKEEKRAEHGVEITLLDFILISKPEDSFPLSISDNALHCSVETNLNNRTLTLRRPDQRAILKLSEGIIRAFSSFMYENEFTRISPPAICNTTLNPTRKKFIFRYFGEDAFLSSDKQISMQAGVAFFDRVFSVSDVFRADNHNSTRHLNEFTSLDFEMGFIENLYDIINILVALVQYTFNFLNKHYKHELDLCNTTLPSADNILTLSFKEVADILNFKKEKKDIDPTDAVYICEYAKKQGSDFVIITHLPSEKYPVNYMDSPSDNTLCESFVMLCNGLEIAGGGQKIHSYTEQITKLESRSLSPVEYADFLELHKYALPPHGGCSIGLERLLMKLIDLENVKLASLFPRDMHHTSF